MRGMRLRTKLLLVYLVPAGVMLAAGGSWAYWSARRDAERDLGERLVTIAKAAAGILASGSDAARLERLAPGMPRTHANLRRKLLALAQATGARRIFVLDRRLTSKVDTKEGVPVGARVPEAVQDLVEIQAAFRGEARASLMFTTRSGQRFLTGYAPVEMDGRVVAVLGVEGSSALFGSLDRLAMSYGTAGLVLLVTLLGLSLVVSDRITRPVRELASAAARIGEGDLDTPVPVSGSDELGLLARSLDDMRRAIQAREQELQLMLSGIAHEVRNPLGGMELFLGLLSDELPPRGQARTYLERVERELAYLERVVDEFLDFARRRPLSVTRFSLRELVRRAAAGLPGCRFQLRVPEITMAADRAKLLGVFLNLMKNGCQAARGDGEVTVSARVIGERVEITVEDRGPGFTDEALESGFRPFFTTREKGTGLGLALCRKVVVEHRGEITLGNRPEGGAIVTVVLPLEQPGYRVEVTGAAGPMGDDEPGGLIGDDEPGGLIGDDEPGGPIGGDEPGGPIGGE